MMPFFSFLNASSRVCILYTCLRELGYLCVGVREGSRLSGCVFMNVYGLYEGLIIAGKKGYIPRRLGPRGTRLSL